MNHTYPQALTALPNWVCWRLEQDKTGRDCKIPYNPNTTKKASSTNPATWSDLPTALDCAERYIFGGVGFVFTAESGIIGIDLDKCLDEHGQPNETAVAILARIPPTYTEVSPSGRGLHIFLKGTLPTGGNRKETVEMYSTGRYFTMTGNRYNNCADTIADDNGAIAWIHETYIKTQTSRKQKHNQSNSEFIVGLSDDKLLEMARNAKDGAAFTALWDGQWQGKYKSQSEADFALCCKLVFWSRKNTVQVDRLFRQSGLMKQLRKVKDSNGQYIWSPSVVAGTPDMILGRPVYTSPFVPEIAAGALPLAFGDFSFYWIVDRRDIRFKVLNELFAERDQVGFHATERIDGKMILSEAVMLLKMNEQ